MNNYYGPCFYRIDFVVIPSYVKLSWFQERITLEICYFWHCSCQALELHLDPNRLQGTVTEIWIGTQGHPCISWNLNFFQTNFAYKQDLIHFWSWKPQVIIPVITEFHCANFQLSNVSKAQPPHILITFIQTKIHCFLIIYWYYWSPQFYFYNVLVYIL